MRSSNSYEEEYSPPYIFLPNEIRIIRVVLDIINYLDPICASSDLATDRGPARILTISYLGTCETFHAIDIQVMYTLGT